MNEVEYLTIIKRLREKRLWEQDHLTIGGVLHLIHLTNVQFVAVVTIIIIQKYLLLRMEKIQLGQKESIMFLLYF